MFLLLPKQYFINLLHLQIFFFQVLFGFWKDERR